jgi:hypothetical protein
MATADIAEELGAFFVERQPAEVVRGEWSAAREILHHRERILIPVRLSRFGYLPFQRMRSCC